MPKLETTKPRKHFERLKVLNFIAIMPVVTSDLIESITKQHTDCHHVLTHILLDLDWSTKECDK